MTTQSKKQWAAMLREEREFWMSWLRPQRRSKAVLSLQALFAGISMFKPRAYPLRVANTEGAV